MKRTVLFGLFMMFVMGLSAQDFTIQNQNDTVYINGSTADLELIGHSTLENNTSAAIKILLVRTENNYHSSWSGSYICAGICWPPEVDSFEIDIPANATSKVDIHFMNDFLVGKGDILTSFQMLDANGVPFGSTTEIRYIANSFTVDVVATQKDIVKFFPNPVTDVLNVTLNTSSPDAVVEMYNIIGKRLASYSSREFGKNFQVQVANLPKGTYLLRLRENGNVYTKKFQKVN